MSTSRLFRRAFLGATALTILCGAGPAAAQRIDRIIVFGDSYADTGNALRLAGINPLSTQVYTTGRFSGGTNYIDTLSDILDVPQYNFAIGGARTNNGNQTAGLPGLTFEVQQFVAGGGNLGFPTVDTTLDLSDLVAVSIGGNDARNYQQTGGTLAGASAAAATAVTSFQQNFDLVMEHGTPTISFLAGDTGRLPEIATNPSGAAVRTAYSTAFNGGVQQVLAGYADQGSIVHYLDLSLVLDQVSANPAAYGVTNGLVCPIFPNTTCALNSNGYLFYGDALHLTSQGFAIVGQYVATQLQAPLTLAAPSELGLDTARQFGRTLSSRVDLTPPRDGDVAEGMKLFLVGDTLQHDARANSTTDSFDVDTTGGTAGIEYGFGNGTVGIAGNYSRGKAQFGTLSSRTEAKSWQVGGFAGFAIAGGFAQGYVGYGRDSLEIRRRGVVDPMTSSPDGSHWLAGAKAGYLLPVGIMRAGPVVALDYAKAKVDSYTEEGDPALTLNVGSVSAKSFTGSVGAELRGDFAVSGLAVRPFASAVLEKQLLDDARTVRFAQTSAPGIVNRWALEERSRSAYGRFSFGGSAAILSSVTLDALGSATVGKDDGNDVSATVGLHVGF